ncbi:MAG TPA: hypothetical protein VJZ32_11020 [Candidatus Bathyarchaeia archaeon]|nr:hypothetical protein [Candidatus Bathyarchaeia archaeon]
MGAQQCSAESSDQRSLSFKLGNETIRVVTLGKEEVLESSKVLDTILYVTSLRQTADVLYLAAPRLLATTLDSQIFKTHGLGLILFDDRRIEETIEGRTAPELAPKPINTPVPDQNLLSEFTVLKSMYAQMEKTIENMREEMKAMNQSTRTEPRPPIRMESVEPPPAYTITPHPAQGPLPSFFNNNPWLEVLSRRGHAEEVTRLAG